MVVVVVVFIRVSCTVRYREFNAMAEPGEECEGAGNEGGVQEEGRRGEREEGREFFLLRGHATRFSSRANPKRSAAGLRRSFCFAFIMKSWTWVRRGKKKNQARK